MIANHEGGLARREHGGGEPDVAPMSRSGRLLLQAPQERSDHVPIAKRAQTPAQIAT